MAQEVLDGGQAIISWAFLYSDCEHEVLPVTSGTRVTIAYDIFTQPKDGIFAQPQDTGSHILKRYLASALDNPRFFPEGGILGFGLQHSYPQGAKSPAFLAELKGSDAIWLRALHEVGITTKFVAIYRGLADDGHEARNPKTEAYKRRRGAYKSRILLASSDFYLYKNVNLQYDDVDLGVDLGEDVVWVTTPGAYGLENHYISYGNEVS